MLANVLRVRVHLLAALLHSRTSSTRLVVASLGVHDFDSATCDHSRHRQIRGHLNVFEGNLVAHAAFEVMGGVEDSALDQTRSIVAEDREPLQRNGYDHQKKSLVVVLLGWRL